MFKIYYLKSGSIIACIEEDDILKDILQVKLSQQGFMYVLLGYPINEELVSIVKQDISIMFEITKYNNQFKSNYEVAIEKIKHPDIIQPSSGLKLN